MTLEEVVFHVSPKSAVSYTSPNFSTASLDSTNTSLSTRSTEQSCPAVNTTDVTTGSDDSTFPAKTDKPRPHICGICGRPFARLEHLKRHERSHTKEKPYECADCTRCFARRDLLLRHQQKLHLTTTPSSRAKGRRESTSAVTSSSKVHKGSASTGSASVGSKMRPRANTISHIDNSTLEFLASSGRPTIKDKIHPNIENQIHITNASDYGLRIDTSVRPRMHARAMSMVPRSAFGLSTMSSGLPLSGLYDVDENLASGSTVDPAQLHLDEMNTPIFVGGEYEWYNGLNHPTAYNIKTEHTMDPASPSVFSHDSPMMGNGNIQDSGTHHMPMNGWTDMNNHNMMTPSEYGHFNLDYSMKAALPQQMLPRLADNHYPTPPPASSMSPMVPLTAFTAFQPSLPFTPLTSTSDTNFFGRFAASTITELTRQALIASLSQNSFMNGTSHRRFSQPVLSSQLSPLDAKSPMYSVTSTLPSTEQLQIYVSAYIHYFHPHCPFLHIPTLAFDSPAYTTSLHSASYAGHGQGGIVGGAGCLILAMAAVGALYEFDQAASRDLFEAAKKLIQIYLEERRKADLAAASNSIRSGERAAQNTPLWLVQAMLLNVVYGHNCGDKISGDIASTHCAALVSLARAAGLLSVPNEELTVPLANNIFREDEHTRWTRWAAVEERTRTLFALYHMSSLLVSGYNHAPSIMNSEIHLDLPCDESLWTLDSASKWSAQGGELIARQHAVSFSAALSKLLAASSNPTQHVFSYPTPFSPGVNGHEFPRDDLQPSTFGCLVLIDALHNYVWETRQRHSGRVWTTQETEAMYAHMEPALRAWQAAWASNPTHSLERPNPYGLGPLATDSIPLLDLAYVRLFVNLGASKEAFWQRNFDAMAEEIARGSDIITHAEHSENSSSNTSASGSRKASISGQIFKTERVDDDMKASSLAPVEQQTKVSKRERHLRRAAFYAADSLAMCERLGVTFAQFTSRELPIQSAMCAFDCAQVLAEWLATLQERVGRYLGVLGQAPVDFSQVPAMLLLEDEDCKLLGKVRDYLSKAETRMSYEISSMGNTEAAMSAMNCLPSWSNAGFGSQILLVTAYMLKRAAVWPVTSLMAHGLEVQAAHMSKRVANSTTV